MDDLEDSFERAEYLQSILISEATGGAGDNTHYQSLRREFITNTSTKPFVPRFVRTSRDLSQFWQFIKFSFPSYAERRDFIWSEFNPLLEHLEVGARTP
jgi:hypothetical protein